MVRHRTPDWRAMPDHKAMFVTNPFNRSGLATAFVVRRIEIVAPGVPPVDISWYSKQAGSWQDKPLPTRGEYLIQRGGASRLRSVAAVLELQSPYLAVIRQGAIAPKKELLRQAEAAGLGEQDDVPGR
jgi:hypothetical protein